MSDALTTAATWDIADTGQPTRTVEFRTSQATWTTVTVSPDGETIVFDLLGDLYALPAPGGDAELLLGGPAMHKMPIFGMDGRLLFLSDADGYDNAWVCDADGGNLRQLTHETDQAILTEPVWGPSGSLVAGRIFPQHRKLFASQIRLFEVERGGDSDGRVLVDVPSSGRDVLEATVSADGAYVYYTERLANPRIFVDANHTNFAIRRLDLAQGRTDTVVGGFGGAIRPVPSPDGRFLAFLRRVKARTVLFCLDLTTGEQRPVFDDLDRDNQAVWEIQGNYFPRFSWFPDSRSVAIWCRGGIARIDMRTGVKTPIPFSARCRHTLIEPVRPRHELVPAEVPARALRHPAYAPGGRDAVFVALGRLWHTSFDGARPTPVGDHGRHAAEPAYRPDGLEVAYVEWDDERGSRLCRVRAGDWTDITEITATTAVIRQPVFSPDGQTLAYRIQPHDAHLGGARLRPGIYLVDRDGGSSTFLTEADDAPMFSPDGERVYATVVDQSGDEPSLVLFSVDRQGRDRREHARTSSVDTYELRLSPDGRWLAFRDQHRYHLVPYRETGHPLTVAGAATEVPGTTLVENGGHGLSWAPDGRSLHWAIGPRLHSLDVAVDGAVDPAAARVDEIELTVPADAPGGRIALVGARVITMRDEEVIEKGTVVVEDNRITAVGSVDAVPVPADATVIDCAGKTIMPGLVDGHGHIDGAVGDAVTPQKQPSRYAALAFGVTTNFDPFSSELPTFESTETTQAGLTRGPRWIATGSAIHGRPHNFFHLYTPIDSFADALRVVRNKAALGAISVKSYKWPARKHRQMLVKAAREVGVNIVVEGETHFYNNISMILDGHTNLEHNLPVATMYDDVVQLMAAADVSNTPTLVVAFGELFGENWAYQRAEVWKDPRVRTYIQACLSGYSPLSAPYEAPPHVRGMTTIHVADEVYDIGVLAVSRSVRRLDEAGVRINAGSHGQMPGMAMHWEMALLAEGGMSPHRVLRTATANTAESLGVGDQIGSLETGKLADLIVLDANPLEDIQNSARVVMTMVNGRLLDAQTLDEIAPDPKQRTRFLWELQDTSGIDWAEPWGGGCGCP